MANTNNHTQPKKSKITFKDVARALYWLHYGYDSKCPYCQEELDRDKKGVIALRHLRLEHPDIAYKQEQL